MKIEWFVTNVTAARSPDTEERVFWGVFGFAVFEQFRPIFVVREPLCNVGTPS